MADRVRAALRQHSTGTPRARRRWHSPRTAFPSPWPKPAATCSKCRKPAGWWPNSLAAPLYRLVYQSRSGAPGQPWLGPDVLEYLRELAAAGAARDVVLAPIGFISDHMEVVYDLDTEARQLVRANWV